MKNRKVWKLVQLLDEKEKASFDQWLKGELGNTQKSTVQLYCLLRDGYAIKEIWEGLYPLKAIPDRPFYDSGFRRLEHSLTVLIERYFALQALDREEHLREIYTLKELKKRKARGLIEAKIRKIELSLDSGKIRDERYHYNLYVLEREITGYFLSIKGEINPELSRKVSRQFDVWWLHEKMLMALSELSLNRVHKKNISEGLWLNEVLSEINQNTELHQYPVLMIYFYLYQLLIDKGDPGVIVPFIKKNMAFLARDGKKDVYVLLYNYYSSKSNASGESFFLEKLLEISVWGIGEGYLLANGILPLNFFTNVIRICLKLHRTELAKKYLKELGGLLAPAEREEGCAYNLALVYMAEGAYDMAIPEFNKRFSTPLWEISARVNLIKIRYLKGEREDLINGIRALKVFVQRKPEIGAVLEKAVTNELKSIEKLVKAYGRNAFLSLREKVLNTKPMTNADWIVAQIDSELGG